MRVCMHEWTCMYVCMYVCMYNSLRVRACVCVQQLDTYDHEISIMMQLKLMYDIIRRVVRYSCFDFFQCKIKVFSTI